jgi:pimeloyl-ACP methyl ester carboxylesterase
MRAGWKDMKRGNALMRLLTPVRVFALLLAAFILFAYLRPLTLVFIARDLYLYGIGMRSAEVRVGGHRVHYYVGGEGPPLVMVHGIASRAADAALAYRALAKGHRVYALDLLGFGESDKPPDASYTVAMQAELVQGFLNAMHLRKTDLLGVSLGGWIALKVAAERPERVRRLVLVSSAGLKYPTELQETSFSPTNLEELRASFARQTDAKVPEFVLRDFLRRSGKRRWVVTRSMRSALKAEDALDGRLQRVTMPVLLVWGTHDRIIPIHVAASMQREMPHARLVRLEGCGHLAIIECRDRALPAIVKFLAE